MLGLLQLPYPVTQSVTEMLEFLATHPQFDYYWMACQLKMGLFFPNIHGRICWYILVSSLLYTFQQLVQFTRAYDNPVQIVYRPLISYGRGPVGKEADFEARI